MTFRVFRPAQFSHGRGPQFALSTLREFLTRTAANTSDICRDVCIPGQKQLELSLPVKNHAAPSLAHELFAAARARVPRPTPRNWKISAASIGDEFVLNLHSGESTEVRQFFPLDAEQIENVAPQDTTVFSGGVRLHLKKSNQLLRPIARLRGALVVDSERAYLVNVPVSQSIKNVHAQMAD